MRNIKKNNLPVLHEQWIEVTREHGTTVSTFYPPNVVFERLRQDCDPTPTLIYRRINFVDGVPDEYLWTQPPAEARLWGGHFIHRMKVADWLRTMALEDEVGTGHVLPSNNPQPRPAEFGPCPCARCRATADKPTAYTENSPNLR